MSQVGMQRRNIEERRASESTKPNRRITVGISLAAAKLDPSPRIRAHNLDAGGIR